MASSFVCLGDRNQIYVFRSSLCISSGQFYMLLNHLEVGRDINKLRSTGLYLRVFNTHCTVVEMEETCQ